MALTRVETVIVGDIQANCYLVENPDTRQLLIVDPGDEAEKIIRAVGDRRPVAVLATHGHFDHIGGANAFKELYGCQLCLSAADAAIEAARLRLRPIIMTSLAFVLGVFPLVKATGAGAGARQSMGTGVFGGMLAATFIATLFVPLFFKWLERGKQIDPSHMDADDEEKHP